MCNFPLWIQTPCAAADHGSEKPFSLVHLLVTGSYISIRSYSVRLFPVNATPPVASILLPDTAPLSANLGTGSGATSTQRPSETFSLSQNAKPGSFEGPPSVASG